METQTCRLEHCSLTSNTPKSSCWVQDYIAYVNHARFKKMLVGRLTKAVFIFYDCNVHLWTVYYFCLYLSFYSHGNYGTVAALKKSLLFITNKLIINNGSLGKQKHFWPWIFMGETFIFKFKLKLRGGVWGNLLSGFITNKHLRANKGKEERIWKTQNCLKTVRRLDTDSKCKKTIEFDYYRLTVCLSLKRGILNFFNKSICTGSQF